MRIGLCSSDFEPMTADDYFCKLKSFGFEVTQVAFASIKETGFVSDGVFEIPWSVDDNVLKHIKSCADKYGIEIISVNGTFNMIHPDKTVRDEAIARFEGFSEAVLKLGCHVISLCSGTREKSYLWKYHPDNNTPQAWEDMISMLRKLVAIAEKRGITLVVETEASNVINSSVKARRMLDEVGSPYLKMILDCANLFNNGEAHMDNVRPLIKEAFDNFGYDIASAHGKDIREGEGIDFCPAGHGIVDFGYFISLLKQYGYSGDMLLHGIYKDEFIPSAIELIKKELKKA